MIIQNSLYTLKFPSRKTEITLSSAQDFTLLTQILSNAQVNYKSLTDDSVSINLTAPKLKNILSSAVNNPFTQALKADLTMCAQIW